MFFIAPFVVLGLIAAFLGLILGSVGGTNYDVIAAPAALVLILGSGSMGLAAVLGPFDTAPDVPNL